MGPSIPESNLERCARVVLASRGKANTNGFWSEEILEMHRREGVELDRFIFALNAEVVWGKAQKLVVRRQPQPSTPVVFLPDRLFINLDEEGVLSIRRLTPQTQEVVRNEDAFKFCPIHARSLRLEMPTIGPADFIEIEAVWTGRVAKGYDRGSKFVLSFDFDGLGAWMRE